MTVPVPIVEWAPDKGPYELVDTYANLTGASGAYVSTPDADAYTFTNFEIVARVAFTDWTPSSSQAICSRVSADPNRNWRFYVNPSGQLTLDWFPTGLGASLRTVSGSALGATDGTAYWVKVTFEDNSGGNNRASFYWAADSALEPTSWTAVGTGTNGASFAGFPNVATPLEIGSGFSGTSQQAVAKFYQVLVRNGIGGTTVAEFHADRDSIPGSSTFVSTATGETWTFNGAASRVSDWVDLTDYVQDGSVQTGRQYEVDQFNAGTASLTLVATTRLFDPDNTAGTYYGKLVPMRQFRIRMTRSSTTYPVFCGYVTDWGQVVPAADRAIYTAVQLADAFALLDATAAPSPYESAVLAKSPTAYFRLHDTNSIPARTGSGTGTWSSTPTLTTPLIANDASRSWSADGGVYGKVSPFVTSANTCVEFWMSTTATTGTIIDANAAGIRVLFYLAAGRLRVYRSDTGRYYETTNVVNTGTVQNIYFNFATNAFVINGAADAGTDALATPDELGGVTIETGVWYLGTNQARTYPYVGVLDELAIYSTNVGNNYTVGTTPWSGQTTGARVTAILDAIGWPAALRDIDTGDSTMQTADISGVTALGAIQQAADTELGQTYVDAYGRVTHRARSTLWMESRSKVSQVVVCDAYGAPEYVNLPGASGAYVSTPDAAKYTFAGTYRVMVRVRATDWTTGNLQVLMGQYDTAGNQRAWRASITATGEMQWGRSTDGSAPVFQVSSAPGLVDGTTYWLGYEYVTTTGAVTFYKADDSQSMPAVWSGWTQVSTHTMTSGTPFNAATSVLIGANQETGTDRLTGRVYEARLYDGTTVVAKFDARADGRIGASTFVSSTTGETWTLNGAVSLVEESNVEYSADGFSLVRDETLLRNPVTASRQGGTTITASDAAGITKYGRRDWAAPVSYDSSDNVINDRATFLLGRYKELATRISNVTVDLHRDPATATPLIGARQIGDRITVYRRPLNTGGRVISEQVIEGISHRFAPQRWSTSLRASPVETGVFLILDDATYGQLDQEALGY